MTWTVGTMGVTRLSLFAWPGQGVQIDDGVMRVSEAQESAVNGAPGWQTPATKPCAAGTCWGAGVSYFQKKLILQHCRCGGSNYDKGREPEAQLFKFNQN